MSEINSKNLISDFADFPLFGQNDRFLSDIGGPVSSIILMLELSYLTLFLCTQNSKANGVNCSFIRACACLHARKTCFQRFWPNSLNFYRNKIIFNVLWEPLKNAKQWWYLFHTSMASFAVAGVFTYARIIFLFLHA